MSNSSECRFCKTVLEHTFVNLGMSPLANSYVAKDNLLKMEPFYPLHVYVCHNCFLVQLPEFESPEHIFSDYAYFSSYSESWLKHAKEYTELMIERFGYNADSQIVEIASNDGYLLKFFLDRSVPVLGIEPAANVAKVAQDAGIPTVIDFFGVKSARQLTEKGKQADLLLGNNVLAHVPDINDFVQGMKILLKASGVITMEFPHLMQLMNGNQFDTIYHEHFSYLSFVAVVQIFAEQGLTVFDVEELATHGGSLRVYACHTGDKSKNVSEKVDELLSREKTKGFKTLQPYVAFREKVQSTKRNILKFLINAKEQNKTLIGYGAPAKGNTLLNFCGIKTDFFDYTVDKSPHKQGLYLPGTHIPIYDPEKIKETKPDYLVILPWNIKDEIMQQMAHIREWGGRFVVLIPEVAIYP